MVPRLTPMIWLTVNRNSSKGSVVTKPTVECSLDKIGVESTKLDPDWASCWFPFK